MLKLLEEIYYNNQTEFLRELISLVETPQQFKIRSPYDILSFDDILYSTEKVILCKYLLQYSKNKNIKLRKKALYAPYYNLFNVKNNFILLYPLQWL